MPARSEPVHSAISGPVPFTITISSPPAPSTVQQPPRFRPSRKGFGRTHPPADRHAAGCGDTGPRCCPQRGVRYPLFPELTGVLPTVRLLFDDRRTPIPAATDVTPPLYRLNGVGRS